MSTYTACSRPQSVALHSVNIHCLFTPTVCRHTQCQHTLLVHTHSLSPYTVSTYTACSHPQSVAYTVSTYIACSHPQSVAVHGVNIHCLFTPTVCRRTRCLHTLLVHTLSPSPLKVSTHAAGRPSTTQETLQKHETLPSYGFYVHAPNPRICIIYESDNRS